MILLDEVGVDQVKAAGETTVSSETLSANWIDIVALFFGSFELWVSVIDCSF
jgi:hypothetical protein